MYPRMACGPRGAPKPRPHACGGPGGPQPPRRACGPIGGPGRPRIPGGPKRPARARAANSRPRGPRPCPRICHGADWPGPRRPRARMSAGGPARRPRACTSRGAPARPLRASTLARLAPSCARARGEGGPSGARARAFGPGFGGGCLTAGGPSSPGSAAASVAPNTGSRTKAASVAATETHRHVRRCPRRLPSIISLLSAARMRAPKPLARRRQSRHGGAEIAIDVRPPHLLQKAQRGRPPFIAALRASPVRRTTRVSPGPPFRAAGVERGRASGHLSECGLAPIDHSHSSPPTQHRVVARSANRHLFAEREATMPKEVNSLLRGFVEKPVVWLLAPMRRPWFFSVCVQARTLRIASPRRFPTKSKTEYHSALPPSKTKWHSVPKRVRTVRASDEEGFQSSRNRAGHDREWIPRRAKAAARRILAPRGRLRVCVPMALADGGAGAMGGGRCVGPGARRGSARASGRRRRWPRRTSALRRARRGRRRSG